MKNFLLLFVVCNLFLTDSIHAQSTYHKSLKFLGTPSEGVVINPSSSINSFGTTNKFTISAWIKLDSLNKNSLIAHKQQGNCVDDFFFCLHIKNELSLGYNGGCQ